jgi:hypothetical protein
MSLVDTDYHESDNQIEKRFLARAGLFFMASYLGSLRGEEVPRVVRKHFIGLNEESALSDIPHCVLPLFGRFKNDKGVARCYLFRIVCKSKSGLDMKTWVDRVVEFERTSTTMYLFADKKGNKLKGSAFEPYFSSKLGDIQWERRGLIPNKLDVAESYGISRLFRRGSVMAAGNAPNEECSDEDISNNNRWRMEDRSGTKQASLNMLQLYTDTLHSVAAELRFSACLWLIQPAHWL